MLNSLKSVRLAWMALAVLALPALTMQARAQDPQTPAAAVEEVPNA